MALEDRLSKLPQTEPGKERLIADLPPEVLLNAINKIVAGENTTNPQINDLVRRAASEGKNPQQIMDEFITQQRKSASPLIIMGG